VTRAGRSIAAAVLLATVLATIAVGRHQPGGRRRNVVGAGAVGPRWQRPGLLAGGERRRDLLLRGAGFYGSTGGMTLNKPVVAMASTSDSAGYWLVATDGGIFSFGDAKFFGSTGAMTLNEPVVGMARPKPAPATGWWRPTGDFQFR